MRLRRSDLSAPGIERRRRGRGFSYRYLGRPVSRADRERAEALVLPPAWTDVWISPDERGHIQATGVDAAGRTQYRYHDEWRRRRDRAKFAHVAEMARKLPTVRRKVREDLAEHGLTRRRVLAAAVRLLDQAALRVGGEAYAVDDPDLGEATFGLATLRREHVSVRGDRVRLSFPAKGGTDTDATVEDPALARVFRALLRRSDDHPDLLAYRDGRKWVDVKSGDVNDYLREISGLDLTAKDFRTWHGTVAATLSLCQAGRCATASARKRAVAAAMRAAADTLGNTAAVARKSYVDPRIVDVFESGKLPPVTTKTTSKTTTSKATTEKAARAKAANGNTARTTADEARLWQKAERTTMAVLRNE
ncbi:DNA topoisomerase IB [Hamadaea sp. NPDC050747]|uniref:DNA topoisomerase IB n=1 Tax=Hamadaea sp. NPDC050747 TaxID=3155789 RepID=UPI003408995A